MFSNNCDILYRVIDGDGIIRSI